MNKTISKKSMQLFSKVTLLFSMTLYVNSINANAVVTHSHGPSWVSRTLGATIFGTTGIGIAIGLINDSNTDAGEWAALGMIGVSVAAFIVLLDDNCHYFGFKSLDKASLELVGITDIDKDSIDVFNSELNSINATIQELSQKLEEGIYIDQLKRGWEDMVHLLQPGTRDVLNILKK